MLGQCAALAHSADDARCAKARGARNMSQSRQRGYPMTARLASFVVSIVMAALCASSNASDLGRPMMLIAAPQLSHAVYGGSILMAAPIGDGRHIGFIVNRPTHIKLSQLFPEHTPSRKVVDPVYFGGPSDSQLL